MCELHFFFLVIVFCVGVFFVCGCVLVYGFCFSRFLYFSYVVDIEFGFYLVVMSVSCAFSADIVFFCVVNESSSVYVGWARGEERVDCSL